MPCLCRAASSAVATVPILVLLLLPCSIATERECPSQDEALGTRVPLDSRERVRVTFVNKYGSTVRIMQVTARGAEVLHSILPYRDATASTSGNQTWSSLSVQCAVNQRFIVRNHRGRLVAYSTATSDDTDEEGAKSPNHVVILPCEARPLGHHITSGYVRASTFSGTHHLAAFHLTVGSPGRVQRQPHKPADVERVATVGLAHVARNSSFTVHVERTVPCTFCQGFGALEHHLHQCSRCQGKGIITAVHTPSNCGYHNYAAAALPGARWSHNATVTCPVCFGYGRVPHPRHPCPLCGGNRTVRETVPVVVPLPAGAMDELEIRAVGVGSQAPLDLAADFVFTVQVKEDPSFVRKGLDLLVQANITLGQALGGFNISIMHPDGEHAVDVARTGRTSPGKRLRVRGAGLPRFTGEVPPELLSGTQHVGATKGPQFHFRVPEGAEFDSTEDGSQDDSDWDRGSEPGAEDGKATRDVGDMIITFNVLFPRHLSAATKESLGNAFAANRRARRQQWRPRGSNQQQQQRRRRSPGSGTGEAPQAPKGRSSKSQSPSPPPSRPQREPRAPTQQPQTAATAPQSGTNTHKDGPSAGASSGHATPPQARVASDARPRWSTKLREI